MAADSRRPRASVLQHRPVVRRGRRGGDYWDLSARPLHILLFLVPFIVLFELGSSRYLADPAHGTVETIRAWSMLLAFFQDFGVAGRFLPAATILTVLVVWHVMLRDSWRVEPWVPGAMLVESLIWTVPLIVAVKLVLLLGAAVQPAVQAAGGIEGLSRQGRISISIGAGLYEELLFRMIGIALLHAVLVDLFRIKDRWGTVLAVVISAVAFAAYHDPFGADRHLQVLKACSLVVAGGYFGTIYLLRGFGIAVGVHVMYDVLVLVALRPS
jgi:membrane protease YdiL (CAAX protease family)